jgi:UDP-glucuronate decarboxylase
MNLGNPAEITVLDLAQEVLLLTRSGSRIVHRQLPEDDPRQRRPIIEVARQVLGFSPRIPLREGLRRTIASVRATLRDGVREMPGRALAS